MSKSAAKLAHELKLAGYKPGYMADQKLRESNECFAEFSEAVGCDISGRPTTALSEGFKPEFHLGHDADGYEIRDLFANLVVSKSDGEPVGRSFIEQYIDPNRECNLKEAMDAVDSTAFQGITGQLMVTKVLEAYTKEEYAIRKLIPTWNSPLKQEKWIATTPPADPTDDMLLVPEGQEFTAVGFGEQYVETPLTKKRGKLINLTKEAIFFNLTGDITRQAAEVGDLLAYGEEVECIDALIGASTGPMFVEKRQFDSAPVTLDPYQAAGGNSINGGSYQLVDHYASRKYPFVNDVPNNPLTDYEAIVTCDQYFSNIVDPNRGRPIVVGKPFVIAPHTQRAKLMRVIEAQSIYALSQQGITSPGAIFTQGANILQKMGLTPDMLLTTRLLKQRLQTALGLTSAQADQVWFYGAPSSALVYVVNWPVTVVQSPENSEQSFLADIVLRFKASKRGGVCWNEPRQMLRNNFGTENSSPNF